MTPVVMTPMTSIDMAWAFNEWMRRYTLNPSAFAREFEMVVQYLRQQDEGQEPSYGIACAFYMAQLLEARA